MHGAAAKAIRRQTTMESAATAVCRTSTAVQRLAFLGLIVCLMGPCVYAAERVMQPERMVGSPHAARWFSWGWRHCRDRDPVTR
jgi:hypothetical protein